MNIAAQHVSPERLMALLDNELSPAEAQQVSTHLEDCTECARMVEQLRRTSEVLSTWKVPEISANVEQAVTGLATKVESGIDIGKPKLSIRASFWGWKQWTAVSVAAVSALVILAAIATPNLMRSKAQLDVAAYIPAQQGKRETVMLQAPEGTVGELQTRRQSHTLREPIVGNVMGGVLGGVRTGSGGGVGRGRFSGVGNQAAEAYSMNGQPATDQQSEVSSNPIVTPMIAQTVSLSIVVKDFAGSRSALDAIVGRYRGYAAQLSASTTENAPRSLQASLRIPASVLSSAVTDFKALGRVENESQTGEEVTHQHADLVARLRNSRETEQRLREILEQRAGKISDVLKVEEEIARVRGEIESMETEQKALEHRVDFASVDVQLTEEYKAQLNPPAPSVSTRINNAFVAGYHNVSDTILGILLFFIESGPVLLLWLAILGIPTALAWRRYRRIRATI